jgi:hypothetical protein
MGVGLSIKGRYRGTPRTLLSSAGAMVRTWAGEELIDLAVHEGDDQGYLGIQLHPAAEAIELRVEGESVEVSAKTSTAGPGYHAWVCELLDALRAAGIEWMKDEAHNDETGYFESRDYAALEQEMLLWLRGLATVMRQKEESGNAGFHVSMATDHTFEHDGAIATPLGPRDADWLRRVEEDPRAGIDIFPWWEQGRGAGYELGRALALIWTEVRFRPPLWTDETRTLNEVLQRLARAHALDPKLDYPWRTWTELLTHAGVEAPQSVRPREDQRPPLGYRRRPVRKHMGGFSIQIPGEFAEQLTDDGWRMWCGDKTIWATVFRSRDPERVALPEGDPPAGRPITLDTLPSELLSRAAWELSEEDDAFRLDVEIAAKARLLLLTILFDEYDDIEWAVEIASTVQG